VSSGHQERDDLVEKLEAGLREMSSTSVLLSHAIAGRLGMNPTDLEALEILHRLGPMTAGGLAEATGLTTGAITGIVDRLERDGYARRARDPHDRRRVIVRPELEHGIRTIAPLFASMGEAMGALLARYSDEELVVVLDFVTRANAVTHAETAKLRDKPPAARGSFPAGTDERERG
jgi:DNA-binding MarR family transcriptional regulator